MLKMRMIAPQNPWCATKGVAQGDGGNRHHINLVAKDTLHQQPTGSLPIFRSLQQTLRNPPREPSSQASLSCTRTLTSVNPLTI